MGVALFIHPEYCWTLDFSVSHMDRAGRQALSSHKLLIVKTVKSQVVWCLLNKETVAALCCLVGSQ